MGRVAYGLLEQTHVISNRVEVSLPWQTWRPSTRLSLASLRKERNRKVNANVPNQKSHRSEPELLLPHLVGSTIVRRMRRGCHVDPDLNVVAATSAVPVSCVL